MPGSIVCWGSGICRIPKHYDFELWAQLIAVPAGWQVDHTTSLQCFLFKAMFDNKVLRALTGRYRTKCVGLSNFDHQ